MDISVHSLIRMVRMAEPLMTNGGAILTKTYYSGEKVVEHYNIMGPVKAAVEGTMRALAVGWGQNASASMNFRRGLCKPA